MDNYDAMSQRIYRDASSMERFVIYHAYNPDTPTEMDRLVDTLEQAISIAFNDYPIYISLWTKQKKKLLQKVALFNTEVKNSSRHGYTLEELLVVRLDMMHDLIYALFTLLESYLKYSSQQDSAYMDQQLTKDHKDLCKRMSSSFTKLNQYELRSTRIDRKTNVSIVIDKNQLDDRFRDAFNPSFKFERNLRSSIDQDFTSPNYEIEQTLRNFPPNLLTAYKETESLRAEVAKSADLLPEDSYFIEQITESYYPAILSALKTTPFRNMPQKEAFATEITKQFESMQLGLHKITDTAVRNRMSELKAQTEFLQNKVLDTHSLSLSSATLDAKVENDLRHAKIAKESLAKEQLAANCKPIPETMHTEKTAPSGNEQDGRNTGSSHLRPKKGITENLPFSTIRFGPQ